jgi:hypothetical protein
LRQPPLFLSWLRHSAASVTLGSHLGSHRWTESEQCLLLLLISSVFSCDFAGSERRLLRVIALCLAYSVDVGSSELKETEREEGESTIDLREYAIIDLALAAVRHWTSVRNSSHVRVLGAYISDY